jgi:hypothetical protein
MAKNSAESFKDAIDSLTRARDEARVSLHLLSMEGRKKWDEFEEKARGLEQRLGDQAEHLSDLHVTKAQELSRSIREFVDAHVRKTSGS